MRTPISPQSVSKISVNMFVMEPLSYTWTDEDAEHELRMVHVPGTEGVPFMFGSGDSKVSVECSDFYIASTPVTQSLWTHVMGSNPSCRIEAAAPVENVSWEDIAGGGGFLDRINASSILSALAGTSSKRFRLPSETEWEYAARGGPNWTDGFTFSGSNDPDEVAWYGLKWSGGALKWRFHKTFIGRLLFGTTAVTRPEPQTHPVARKAPNRLGIYDMCGNVWEWCEDVCTEEPPKDGTPYLGPGYERRLRGGCFNNWDFLCSVSWRYGIAQDSHDGCIGFRLALS